MDSSIEIALCCGLISLLYYTSKILNWVWFRPKKLEKTLRKQGFNGNSYRLFFGDTKEMSAMIEEAKLKPMNFSNDIVQRVVPIFHKAVTNYGENCFLWFGPRAAVVILDPDIIREVMSKNYTFKKRPGNAFTMLAKGVASLETHKWAKHRRLINPAFHIDKLKHMVPSFYLSCGDMLSKWEKISVASESGLCEVDVWPYLQAMTSDAISRIAFGSCYEEGRKIFDLQREQAQHVTKANHSVYIPGRRFLPTKFNMRKKEIAREVENSLLGIISRRLKAMEAGEGCSDDLLGLLLESNNKEINEHGSKFGMSLKEVIEECKLFYFAGQETTASLLVWTMIFLSKNKEWQASARDEVLHVFGRGKPDYQELNRLKVISMIFHEVLRLYPPVVFLTRVTQTESTLGKHTLPAGVMLMMPTILVQHDHKMWGDDASEFNPERFSEGVSRATQGQLTYFPFGWGPRVCLGQNFAMLEAKMAISMILQHYSLDLSPSYAHAPHNVITLQPQHGAHLILTKLFP